LALIEVSGPMISASEASVWSLAAGGPLPAKRRKGDAGRTKGAAQATLSRRTWRALLQSRRKADACW